MVNVQTLQSVLDQLYPDEPHRPIWESAMTPKLYRVGTPVGFLWALFSIRGYEKWYKIVFEGVRRMITGSKPIRAVGTARAPASRAILIYNQGSSNGGVIFDRVAGQITKIQGMTSNRTAKFDQEVENLIALNEAGCTAAPVLIGHGETPDESTAFMTQELLPGRPCPVGLWEEFLEGGLIPEIAEIATTMARPGVIELDPHLEASRTVAITKGWPEPFLDAVTRALQELRAEGAIPDAITGTLVHHDLARHNVLVLGNPRRPDRVSFLDWARAYRHSFGAQIVELERQTLHYRLQVNRHSSAPDYWRRVMGAEPVKPQDLLSPGLEQYTSVMNPREPLLDHPSGLTALLLIGILETTAVYSPRNRKVRSLLGSLYENI